MPDVAVSTVPCPMCGVDQPASVAYTRQCTECKRYGMECCIDAEVDTFGEVGAVGSTVMFCKTCKKKKSADV